MDVLTKLRGDFTTLDSQISCLIQAVYLFVKGDVVHLEYAKKYFEFYLEYHKAFRHLEKHPEDEKTSSTLKEKSPEVPITVAHGKIELEQSIRTVLDSLIPLYGEDKLKTL